MVIFFNTNTWSALIFGQKCDEELVGQAEGQTGGHALLHV